MLITKWLATWKPAARKQNRRAGTTHTAMIETMENRTLLTAVAAEVVVQDYEVDAEQVYVSTYDQVSFDGTTGVISIAGGLSADEVSVDYDSSRGTRKVQVLVSGATELEIAATAVTSIIFEGFSGADHFTNNTEIRVSASGGSGDDTLYGGGGQDSLYGGNGNDYIEGGRGDDLIQGDDDDDVLHGQAGKDILAGGGGQDVLHGGIGDDTLKGGADNDELHGNDASDSLRGGDGNDTLYGGSEEDTLYGGDGDDFLAGHDGNDEIHGDSGSDQIEGNDGDDDLNGGSGPDNIQGGSGHDKINGNGGGDEIRGGSGADEISGGDGEDDIQGGDGNDVITGDAGDDDLYGNGGHDEIDGGTGRDEIHGGDGTDALSGGDQNDVIYGDAHGDTLRGDAGDDSLYGGSGWDTLYGDSGNDLLSGMDDDDGLFGGNGEDTLKGGSGDDRFLTQDDDTVVDYDKHTDADIQFEDQNGDTTRLDSNRVDWDAGNWTEADIELIDQALAVLHHTVGNTTLLKRSNLKKLTFHRLGDPDDPTVDILAWNSGYGNLHFPNTAFNNGDQQLWQTIFHEIGHNWDEGDNPDWGEWKDISDWEYSLFGGWSHNASSSDFARPYGATKPVEDWATVFAFYFMCQMGEDYQGDGETNRNTRNAIDEKFEFIDEWVDTL
jgi:Ca2+-binding RTX toxin-like protein